MEIERPTETKQPVKTKQLIGAKQSSDSRESLVGNNQLSSAQTVNNNHHPYGISKPVSSRQLIGADNSYSDNSVKSVSDIEYDLFMRNSMRVIDKAKIKSIRIKYNMTQLCFADLLDVPLTTYTSWERGVRKPSSPAVALLHIADKYPKVFLEGRKEITEMVKKWFGGR